MESSSFGQPSSEEPTTITPPESVNPSSVADTAAEVAAEIKDRVETFVDTANDYVDDFKSDVSDLKKEARTRVEELASDADTEAHKHPWQLAGVALAVGTALGLLLASHTHSSSRSCRCKRV